MIDILNPRLEDFARAGGLRPCSEAGPEALDGLAQAAAHPITQMIDSLLGFETDNMRWLSERGPMIARMIAETEAENAAPHIEQGA